MLSDVFTWVMANWLQVLLTTQGALGALIALFLVIPGEQPEKALQWFLDKLKYFSKK